MRRDPLKKDSLLLAGAYIIVSVLTGEYFRLDPALHAVLIISQTCDTDVKTMLVKKAREAWLSRRNN